MLFLSAQPDTYYFAWQLELQLHHFHKLGIDPRRIHVLIGYHPGKGISSEFVELMKRSDWACFFAYPDNRKQKNYLSSIRPHIIGQHFAQFPLLEKQHIFYHDSDVLFRVEPDWASMSEGDTWYVSDTRKYLDSRYIIESAGQEVFYKMCRTVGIPTEMVLAADSDAGGAQYVIKYATAAFWHRVEKDCEALYDLLRLENSRRGEIRSLEIGGKISDYKGIQAWCADMWSVLWNALKLGFQVKIDAELDFCWTYEPIERWRQTKILHYSGVNDKNKQNLFYKGRYNHYPPYNDDLDDIDKNTCSLPILEAIEDLMNTRAEKRADLSDVTFLIPFRADSDDRIENLQIVIRYLTRCFHTHIIVMEADEQTKINHLQFPSGVQCLFYRDEAALLHRTRYNSLGVKQAVTPIVSIYDVDVVFPPAQVIQAVQMIREGTADYVLPYDGEFIGVDPLFKKIFSKVLDADALLQNRGKFPVSARRSYGGASFINRQAFLSAGLENQRITSWGPEDVERPKRMKILGYKVKRTPGPLFHLPHKRGINSGYVTQDDYIRMMGEYLKVCSMRKSELLQYVQTMPNT